MSRLNRFLNDAMKVVDMEQSYQLRRRFNPHHPHEDVKYEFNKKNELQYALWVKLKSEFVQHRDELLKEAEGFKEALAMLTQFQQVIDSEVEKVILGGDNEGV